MNIKQILFISIGIVIIFFGLLWMLQGLGIMHISPLLCITNCEVITGKSPTWTLIGLITLMLGVLISFPGRN